VGRDDLITEIRPLRTGGDNQSSPGRALQHRHVPRAAKSAILPSGVPVPVREYNRQTGNQNKGHGRSAEGAPVLAHSATIIQASFKTRFLKFLSEFKIR
jgi:hypothetical protein